MTLEVPSFDRVVDAVGVLEINGGMLFELPE